MKSKRLINIIGTFLIIMSSILFVVVTVQAFTVDTTVSDVSLSDTSISDLLSSDDTAIMVDSLTIYGGQLYVGKSYQETPLIETTSTVVATSYYALISKDNTYYSALLDGGSIGIDFSAVSDGLYTLKAEDEQEKISQFIYTGESQTLQFYTVRVNGTAKQVIIEADSEQALKILVTTVDADSFSDADIVLDPGHGDITGSAQPGACSELVDEAYFGGTCEREVMLVVSEYIGSRLEDHGLVVAYTRTSNESSYEPTVGYTNAEYARDDWDNTKADEVAKTTTVLKSGAKLSLSLHFNVSDETNDDVDVYHSIFAFDSAVTSAKAGTQTPLSQNLYTALNTSVNGSAYSLERDYCLEYVESDVEADCQWGVADYYYPIREYGGAFTNALYQDQNIAYNTYSVSPEALLVELFNGMNAQEVAEIEASLQSPSRDSRLEAIVQAIVEQYGISYQYQ